MEDLILIGSGGCMRELYWQIQHWNQRKPTWNVKGYVDTKKAECGKVDSQLPYLGDDQYLLSSSEDLNVILSVGEPGLRRVLAAKFSRNHKLHFPALLLSEAISADAEIGKGVIVSRDCMVSANVKLEAFAFINVGALVCHDSRIGSYATLAPRVNLAGNVTVGEESYIGINATVRQQITIGRKTCVGAGAVVVKNLPDNVTAVGVPAKELI